MKFKVFQIKRKIDKTLYFIELGEAVVLNGHEKENMVEILESIWHACNICSWNKDGLWEVTRRINDIKNISMIITDNFTGNAGSDLIITDEDKINFTAESVNWKAHKSLEKAKEHLINRYKNLSIL